MQAANTATRISDNSRKVEETLEEQKTKLKLKTIYEQLEITGRLSTDPTTIKDQIVKGATQKTVRRMIIKGSSRPNHITLMLFISVEE